jgi:hypothetical protein
VLGLLSKLIYFWIFHILIGISLSLQFITSGWMPSATASNEYDHVQASEWTGGAQ